jgi:hypothetical protein
MELGYNDLFVTLYSDVKELIIKVVTLEQQVDLLKGENTLLKNKLNEVLKHLNLEQLN